MNAAMVRFGDLDVKRGIARSFEGLFYEKPTELQVRLDFKRRGSGRDTYIDCMSGFGMGKRTTLAIGILQNIRTGRVRPGRVPAIVLTRIKSETCHLTAFQSTLKRANKMKETIEALGSFFGVRCSVHLARGGGSSVSAVRQSHVLITSLTLAVQLLQRRIISPYSVEMVVCDEADAIFAEDSRYSASNQFNTLHAMLEKAQFVLLTSKESTDVETVMLRVDIDPVRIHLQFDFNAVRHYRVATSEDAKGGELKKMLKRWSRGKVVVFTRYAQKAEQLRGEFVGEQALATHYDMAKADRYEAVKQFVAGESHRVLFATDHLPYGSVVRGQVAVIINYDFPHRRNYAHRFVRAGFLGDLGGVVINFTSVENLGLLELVEDFYHISIESLPLELESPPSHEQEQMN